MFIHLLFLITCPMNLKISKKQKLTHLVDTQHPPINQVLKSKYILLIKGERS